MQKRLVVSLLVVVPALVLLLLTPGFAGALSGGFDIKKTASQGKVDPGGTIDYTVDVTVSQPASDVVVRDLFINGVDYVPGSARVNGNPINPTFVSSESDSNRKVYLFNLGNIPVGRQMLTFQGRVDSDTECHKEVVNEAQLVVGGDKKASSKVDTSVDCKDKKTKTPTATKTATATATATATGTATATPTGTPPTATPTSTPGENGGNGDNGGNGEAATSTPTPTETPVVAGEATSTETPTPTLVEEITPTATLVETPTPTETPAVAGIVATPAPTVAGVIALPAAGDAGGGMETALILLALAGMAITISGYALRRSSR